MFADIIFPDDDDASSPYPLVPTTNYWTPTVGSPVYGRHPLSQADTAEGLRYERDRLVVRSTCLSGHDVSESGEFTARSRMTDLRRAISLNQQAMDSSERAEKSRNAFGETLRLRADSVPMKTVPLNGEFDQDTVPDNDTQKKFDANYQYLQSLRNGRTGDAMSHLKMLHDAYSEPRDIPTCRARDRVGGLIHQHSQYSRPMNDLVDSLLPEGLEQIMDGGELHNKTQSVLNEYQEKESEWLERYADVLKASGPVEDHEAISQTLSTNSD